MGIIVILGILVVVSYYLSLKMHPFTKCKFCNGSGKHYGTTYANAHRRCRKCAGTGRKDRLGARLFIKK